jgi:hypothetical protein
MSHARIHANAVLLPDGDALVVGGGGQGKFDRPVKSAELFDVESETWRSLAAQTAGRMYHSTTVLLPDGRVLSAGQNSGSYQTTGEIFSPPYLFRGPRPTIESAPSAVTYGKSFFIATSDAIDKAVLIRPSSTTHQMDTDQRYVRLAFTVSSGGLNAVSPPNRNHAPPGWYMLFLVNSSGVPSVASWIRVS